MSEPQTSSTANTDGIVVEVQSQYLDEQSHPATRRFVFAYTITITNDGSEVVQLHSRHWIITDGTGRTEHVRGPGVVGHHPRLEPTESFVYRSYCPLPTPVGSMRGSFQMVRDDEQRFDAAIEAFTLATPYSLN